MFHLNILLLLLVVVSLVEAEKLSSGEDVKNFVERHIQGYEVRKSSLLIANCILCTSYIGVSLDR